MFRETTINYCSSAQRDFGFIHRVRTLLRALQSWDNVADIRNSKLHLEQLRICANHHCCTEMRSLCFRDPWACKLGGIMVAIVRQRSLKASGTNKEDAIITLHRYEANVISSRFNAILFDATDFIDPSNQARHDKQWDRAYLRQQLQQ